MYDFDKAKSRVDTASVKWDFCKEHFNADGLIPLWVADMDFETAPEIKKAIIKRAEEGIFGYTEPMNSFYEALISWYRDYHDVEINKEWISTSSTLVLALHIIIETFVKKDEKVIIQTPVYHQFKKSIEDNGIEAIESPLKLDGLKYQIDFEDFENKIIHNNVSMFILCNPQNPVGRVWKKEELEKLAIICNKHNVLVVSDEIHGDLIFKGYKHESFLRFKDILGEKLILINSLTKTFNIAGLQLGNVIIPNEELRKKYMINVEKKGLSKASLFGVVASEAGYRYGYNWLKELLQYIEENKNYCKNFINKDIKPLKVIDSEATYLLWIDCRELNMSDKELEDFIINKARLGVIFGTSFGKGGNGFIRVNIGCPRSILGDAMSRLKEAIEELRY